MRANATNEQICSIVGMIGDGAHAVVAVAAAGEQTCTMHKRWSPTMRSSSPALAERVKRTGHMVAGMPGSYHGRDSSLCQQLPFRGRVEVKSDICGDGGMSSRGQLSKRDVTYDSNEK
jgi:hypothetical protein